MTTGSIVKLKVTCLGNSPDTIGVGFNDYGSGCQFIFENGNFDGFSTEEQKAYLDYVGYDPEIANYKFDNVIQLTLDFKNGVFDKILKQRN